MKKKFRSEFERKIAKQIHDAGLSVRYECTKIQYTVPQTNHKYTVDFELPSGVIVEVKGRFTAADRRKHILLKQQHPDLDVRFLFQNANNKIRKGSKTTYGDWCTANGFLYAQKIIPLDWY